MAMTPRQVDRNMDWRVVKITEVNTTTGHIEATDQYDTPMMIDITNKPAFFQVPIVGEMWTVSRRGSDWLLEARYDRDDVSTPLDKMKPGDARIEAPGTVYIIGTKVVTVETSAPPGLVRVSASVTMPFESPAIPPPILQPTAPSTNDILFFDSAKWTNSKLTNAMVSAGAAISYSKLALANSILNADIAAGAGIAYSKLALAGSVVNADISGSAGIAYSKLALANSVANTDIAAGAAIDPSKLLLTAQTAAATATTIFTTTQIDVTGCSLTLAAAGTYLAWASFDFSFPANTGDTAVGLLVVDGVSQSAQAILKDVNTASGQREMVSQTWLFTTSGVNKVAKLQVVRFNASGTAQALLTHTTLTTLRIA